MVAKQQGRKRPVGVRLSKNPTYILRSDSEPGRILRSRIDLFAGRFLAFFSSSVIIPPPQKGQEFANFIEGGEVKRFSVDL